VRDAHNRDEFFDGVRALTGSEAEMLTGEDEGRTTFLGAISDLADKSPTLVVDIGGGSTELIYGSHEPQRAISLEIGCVRMLEKHLASDPPTTEELGALRAEVAAELEKAKRALDLSGRFRLIGVAGTVTQLAAIKAGAPVYDPEITHHMVLSHGDVRGMLRRLASLPYERRKKTRSLEEGRADVIVAGAAILLEVMECFDAAEVLVSEKDILDGLVIGLLEA
jgi:exopolyphosphatase/guanosine-5'-triphosphate,3'-diphosphate pyrophosphatase